MPGLLAYYEVCDVVLNEGWQLDADDVGSPYAYNGNQWVGFESPESVEAKVSNIIIEQIHSNLRYTNPMKELRDAFFSYFVP